MVNLPRSQSRLDTSSSAGNEAAAELNASLQQQSAVFENALASIERLEGSANSRDFGNPDSVAQLQDSLGQVVAAQQNVSAARSKFTQSKASLSTELRQSLARHEERLKNLITRIDQLQKIFEGIQAQLTPQLDSDSRQRHMQAAYRQSMKSV